MKGQRRSKASLKDDQAPVHWCACMHKWLSSVPRSRALARGHGQLLALMLLRSLLRARLTRPWPREPAAFSASSEVQILLCGTFHMVLNCSYSLWDSPFLLGCKLFGNGNYQTFREQFTSVLHIQTSRNFKYCCRKFLTLKITKMPVPSWLLSF